MVVTVVPALEGSLKCIKPQLAGFLFLFFASCSQYYPHYKLLRLSKQIVGISFPSTATIKHGYVYSLDCLWALRTAITVKAAETLLCHRMSYVETSQQGKVEG